MLGEMMLYIVRWPRSRDRVRSESKFTSWDGEVTDATPSIHFLIGKDVGIAKNLLELRYNAQVRLAPGSEIVRKLTPQERSRDGRRG
jgi:hypothetical protein